MIGACFAKAFARPPTFVNAQTNISPSPARTIVEITYREMRFRKPPLVDLYFDVVLRNDRAEQRWFLLPSNLDPEFAAIGSKGGVDGVEVFAPRGKGRVVIGNFLGTGGFRALLLPAGAEVRLVMFPISFWGKLPERFQIELVIAKHLTVGSEDAEAWFGTDPISSAKAEISDRAMDQTRIVRSRHTPDNKEVATVIEEENRYQLQFPLSRQ
jgi:hypothetical protein